MKRQILFLVLFFALCTSLSAQTRIDTTLTMSDGIKIDALYYVPTTAPPTTGYPAIVFVHGFGGSKNEMVSSALSYAQKGYTTSAYSVRGQGNSGGEFDFFTSPRILGDLQEVINFTKSLPNTNKDRVAVAGASQGGIHAWAAAAHHLGVRTIVSHVANGRFDEDWVANEALNWTFARTVQLSSTHITQAFRDSVNSSVQTGDITFIKYFLTQYSTQPLEENVTTPVIIFCSYFDGFFNPSAALKQFKHVPSAKRIVVYPAGHASPSDPNQKLTVNLLQDMWIDYWLKDKTENQSVISPDSAVIMFDSGTNLPHVFSQTDTAYWLNAPTVLPANLSKHTFYFSSNNSLSNTTPSSATQVNVLFNTLLGSTPVAFRSAPFNSDVIVCGTIGDASLETSGSASPYQMNLLLYDVDPSNNSSLPITRGHFQQTNNTSGTKNILHFNLNSAMHTIKSGHVLEARVHGGMATFPSANDFGNYVLGPVVNSTNTLFIGGQSASQFTLYFYDPSVSNVIENTISQTVELRQNYPNPFGTYAARTNATTISFSILHRTNVQLSVFDLLGRSVKELIHETKDAGTYEINFNGNDLPNGVYLYRLIAGAQVITKRAVLMK